MSSWRVDVGNFDNSEDKPEAVVPPLKDWKAPILTAYPAEGAETLATPGPEAAFTS